MKMFRNRTILISTLLIFVIVFLGIIFAVSRPNNFFLLRTLTQVAELSLFPKQMSLLPDQIFVVAINVDTHAEEINTVTANLSYPQELLELLEIDTKDSFATIWFEKESSLPGLVKLTGSLPTPGFSGQATFARLKFKTKQKGDAQVNFLAETAIFRDRDSLNILGQTQGGKYLIQ